MKQLTTLPKINLQCILNPNLGGEGGGDFTYCSFSLNNSEKVKALTLVFCSIQKQFIRNIGAKFGIPNLRLSLDIGQNSDGRISHFQIYGQSFINENYQNSRISHDIDTSHNLEFGPVTKIDKRNRQHQTKLTMTSCQQIVTFLSLFNRIPDSGGADYKTYIFINNDLLSCKN